MVYTTAVSAIRKTALDPTAGYVHEPSEWRFTLSLDIADIFNLVLADRVLFRLVNQHRISTDEFESDLDGCLLTEDGRKPVLELYKEALDENSGASTAKPEDELQNTRPDRRVLTQEAPPYRGDVPPDEAVVVIFVLVMYDVPADRTRIYRKLLRRYLEYIQYSVFHGELTEEQLTTVKHEIRDKLEPDDSLYVFTADIAASVDCTVLGDAEEPGSRFT